MAIIPGRPAQVGPAHNAQSRIISNPHPYAYPNLRVRYRWRSQATARFARHYRSPYIRPGNPAGFALPFGRPSTGREELFLPGSWPHPERHGPGQPLDLADFSALDLEKLGSQERERAAKLRGHGDVAYSGNRHRLHVAFVIEKRKIQHQPLLFIHDKRPRVAHFGERANESTVEFLCAIPTEQMEGGMRLIRHRTVGIIRSRETIFPACALGFKCCDRGFVLPVAVVVSLGRADKLFSRFGGTSRLK